MLVALLIATDPSCECSNDSLMLAKMIKLCLLFLKYSTYYSENMLNARKYLLFIFGSGLVVLLLLGLKEVEVVAHMQYTGVQYNW